MLLRITSVGCAVSHRDDEGAIQQRGRRLEADALAGQKAHGLLDIVAVVTSSPAPILGQVGEHRKQHEAADERERVVELSASQPAVEPPQGQAMPRYRSTEAARMVSTRSKGPSPP
jgi:hypothetical protein